MSFIKGRKFKSYICKFDKPFEDGTVIVNGSMDKQIETEIIICNNGFHDCRALGVAILKKDEFGYYIEGELGDDILFNKVYASLFARIIEGPRQSPHKLQLLEVSLFDGSYRGKLGNGFLIEKEKEND